MPVLRHGGKALSRYEFWPGWIFYLPVVVQSLCQGIRYRDLRLPLVANPGIALGGMVGESKSDILSQAGRYARQWILPFTTLRRTTQPLDSQIKIIKRCLTQRHLSYPLVAKPDQGCRGAGVKLLHSDADLRAYLQHFPANARYLLQKKSTYQAEAGIFYIRYPHESKGKIFSLTLKYTPYVIGDGRSTLRGLIEQDERAKHLAHLYLPRHPEWADRVIEQGAVFPLAFAGSHCKGAIFKNGNAYITQALAARLDRIFDDYPGYHFGRLDVKFKDIHSLMNGEAFEILEMNGASSEAAHIWDSQTPLREIFSTLLCQYRYLYEIGHQQKQAGYPVPTLGALWRAWRHEKRLVAAYPPTD
ncbi:D-alanine--D-alanine ligase (plasmid) [Photobacterium sp. GJ3]|uniref:D-alanine--D-alanine ligase n=1 Tax=Photobacterium sp. GJ3 TaxID=2829502 RepID=UPI001B8C7031|nr:D-alanine--D-alanine ligase [Photobacterium sp. GJ3]QUJ70611.1 D-alanine--D-alanine ligase [Photobacterium sp. GJ3]